ncbi:MAG TPA: alpha/beta fold hydrolase [Solirubrobacterales bacterium]|nr:alpha/beta fold hydrolase [Solirubrobacterales bacterium]
MKEIVIVHGTGGDPEENWFPWLAEEVRERGHKAILPTFPTPEGQELDRWLAVLEEEVGELTPDTVLVGHSLGAGFILRALERSNAKVAGTFLVSGFVGELGQEEFDPLNAPFFKDEFDWDRIQKSSGVFQAYLGSDDPYVPRAKGEELAAFLGVPLIVIDGGGHLNTAAGFRTFEQLLDDMSPVLESGAAKG